MKKRPQRNLPDPAARGRQKLALRTILVATDFSAASLEALRYAQALASQFKAILHLIHVVDLRQVDPELAPWGLTAAELEDRLRRRLHATARKAAPPIPASRCHLRTGKAYQMICHEAQRREADLIILATQGIAHVRDVILGSTAQRVVREASCPVLVVRGEKELLPKVKTPGKQWPVRNILAPVDFSEQSGLGLDYAVQFSRAAGARLTLMHVISIPPGSSSPRYVPHDVSALRARERSAARVRMDELVQSMVFGRVPYQTLIAEGSAAWAVVEAAQKRKTDLIIISTDGRKGVRRIFLGSTAEQVVRHGPCPVLVVGPPAKTPRRKKASAKRKEKQPAETKRRAKTKRPLRASTRRAGATRKKKAKKSGGTRRKTKSARR